MKIDAERLRGFLDCMHDEADERDNRSAQIRDIVKAAKEAGYDTKAIRKVFVRERMDEAERSKQDDLLEAYEGALGGKGRALRAIEGGVPVGVAAKANGVHRATVARARRGNRHVANQTSNATPHDPETGEITETAPDQPPSPAPEFGVGPGTNSESRSLALSASAEQPASNAADVPTREDGRAGERDPDSQTPEIAHPAGSKTNNDGILDTDSLANPAPQDLSCRKAPEASATVSAPAPEDDVMEIPPFLRRERASA